MTEICSFWQDRRNIKINITYNRHFNFVYLLGKIDYSLYGQWHESRLYMLVVSISAFFLISLLYVDEQKSIL